MTKKKDDDKNLPVSYKDALAASAQKVAQEEKPSNTFISLKGGCMSINDEPIADNQLECVVVAYATERTYYDRPYDPDDDAPPACFAQSLENHDLIPHVNVPEPVSDKCKGCPKAEFGTALQGKGPACKTRRKLAVMPSSYLSDPSTIGEADIAAMAIPPTSVKNFSQYANKVVTATGLPPWGVVTLIKVSPHPKKQFEVNFEMVGPVGDEAALAAIHQRIESTEENLQSPYTYDQEDKPVADSDKL